MRKILTVDYYILGRFKWRFKIFNKSYNMSKLEMCALVLSIALEKVNNSCLGVSLNLIWVSLATDLP